MLAHGRRCDMEEDGWFAPMIPANERDDDDEEPGFWQRLGKGLIWFGNEICKAFALCKDIPKH